MNVASTCHGCCAQRMGACVPNCLHTKTRRLVWPHILSGSVLVVGVAALHVRCASRQGSLSAHACVGNL